MHSVASVYCNRLMGVYCSLPISEILSLLFPVVTLSTGDSEFWKDLIYK